MPIEYIDYSPYDSILTRFVEDKPHLFEKGFERDLLPIDVETRFWKNRPAALLTSDHIIQNDSSKIINPAM